jgi:hypothetical protein
MASSHQATSVLPNDPRLNALVASTLMSVHAVLATGIRPPDTVMEQVNTGLNQYVQTLTPDSLAHQIVHAMRHLFDQIATIEGTTVAERKAFLDPAIKSFIQTLRVIPCVGEFLTTGNQ